MTEQIDIQWIIPMFQKIYRLYTEEGISISEAVIEKLNIADNDGREYIYPLLCGVRSLGKTSFSFNEDNIAVFENILILLDKKLNHDGLWWHDVRQMAVRSYSGQCPEEEFISMLESGYELVRRLPPTDLYAVREWNQRRPQDLDKLYEAVEAYRKSAAFKEQLEAIKRFKSLAPYNAMLVNMQKPGSTFVATATRWIEKYGRYPKTGARPLIVLQPFGPVGFVYELNDTEGEPFDEKKEKIIPSGYKATALLNVLKENLSREGIGYREENFGSSLAGFIRYIPGSLESFSIKVKNGHAIDVPHDYDMVVNSNSTDEEKVATIAHELGHYFLGHLPASMGNKSIPDRRFIAGNTLLREFEAEYVCSVVCGRFGIITPSEQYLAEYLEENSQIPDGISNDAALKAAGRVEKMLQAGYPVRKDRK